MTPSAPYRCNLLGRDGRTAASVEVIAFSDSDAILLGNTLEREHPLCTGFEIRAGDRLVYMRTVDASARLAMPPAAE
jgi:hypothetical protein